jgi:stage III sporulation protein SpoIIIAA
MMEGCFLLVAQGTLHAQSISPSTSTPLICGNSTVCYATAGGVESRPRISTSSVFVPQHVREIISWAIMPRMLGYMGLSSILLVGAPGTGKTYTVRQLEDIFAETRWALRVFEVSAVDLLQETIEAEHAIASIFTDAKRHAAEDNW